MFTNPKFASVLAGLICVAVGASANVALGVTAEVAKKCLALTAKAYPPLVPGNPAAGRAKGSSRDAQKYFQKCLANEGNVSDEMH